MRRARRIARSRRRDHRGDFHPTFPKARRGSRTSRRFGQAIASENISRCGNGSRNPSAASLILGVPSIELAAAASRLLAPERRTDVADPRQWLFLDTETTGLAGGTGTYPFLVGIAWWDAGGLEVEQFFMREQSEEHSVLLGAGRAHGGAARARHLQRQNVRLAAARNALPHDARDSRCRRRALISIFCIPREIFGGCDIGSVRLAELEQHVLGWNRGAGHEFGTDPTDLFRLSARRLARSARPDLPPQPNGPARTCRACDAHTFAARQSGSARAGRA